MKIIETTQKPRVPVISSIGFPRHQKTLWLRLPMTSGIEILNQLLFFNIMFEWSNNFTQF